MVPAWILTSGSRCKMHRALQVWGSPAQSPRIKGKGTNLYLLAQKGRVAVEENDGVTCIKFHRKSVWELGA